MFVRFSLLNSRNVGMVRVVFGIVIVLRMMVNIVWCLGNWNFVRLYLVMVVSSVVFLVFMMMYSRVLLS